MEMRKRPPFSKEIRAKWKRKIDGSGGENRLHGKTMRKYMENRGFLKGDSEKRFYGEKKIYKSTIQDWKKRSK